ncbi:hypothetical protein VTP01DRAFT_3048 [Rhizomucor pusillus]|uniref:uncharacterized protein n=1 Tax=Rhizomucor pusillus TaxID=4840 RepID=UPI0037439B7F
MIVSDKRLRNNGILGIEIKSFKQLSKAYNAQHRIRWKFWGSQLWGYATVEQIHCSKRIYNVLDQPRGYIVSTNSLLPKALVSNANMIGSPYVCIFAF